MYIVKIMILYVDDLTIRRTYLLSRFALLFVSK